MDTIPVATLEEGMGFVVRYLVPALVHRVAGDVLAISFPSKDGDGNDVTIETAFSVVVDEGEPFIAVALREGLDSTNIFKTITRVNGRLRTLIGAHMTERDLEAGTCRLKV